MSEKRGVAILGIFVADLAFRAARPPAIGETIIGSGFKMGPGGKGSNQAVAAARAGAPTSFITRLGKDEFGAMALSLWRKEGIATWAAESVDDPTGAAYIYVNERTGENAIIVVPGAAGGISVDDVEAGRSVIEGAHVFVTQLEQPVAAAARALDIAKQAGVTTIFNPAPAAEIDAAIFKSCDFVTPNESEAALLTGLRVKSVDDARRAGDALIAKGAGAALVTLGEQGALLHQKGRSLHIPAFSAGTVVETTGAGDAFNGAFAAALSRGDMPERAARFGCAFAAISVTRPGTAPSMPNRAEAETLMGLE
jgi:ribokinase